VFASKRLPDGRRGYIPDAGINLLFTATWYKFVIETDRALQGMGEPSVLNGPLCMNIDVVDEGVLLPPLERGTRLILSPVGAYNVTQWMQFIEYRPAVVLITETREAALIREREDLTDLLRRERLPEHLKLQAQGWNRRAPIGFECPKSLRMDQISHRSCHFERSEKSFCFGEIPDA